MSNGPRRFEISVRRLVEFMLRSGDITSSGSFSGTSSLERMQRGTLLHQKIQRAAQKDSEKRYEKEVPFFAEETIFEPGAREPCALLRVEGRADGIFEEGGDVWVDEIKSTVLDLSKLSLETYPEHSAQAKCYACFVARERELPRVGVQLTYVHVESEQTRFLRKIYEREELEEDFAALLEGYGRFLAPQVRFEERRDRSLRELSFPYPAYRPMQRAVAAHVYKTLKEGGKLFIQAPTGIGKTLSVIFPALHVLGEGGLSKIFYLTAKNVTGQAALSALTLLRERSSLVLKSIVITAKDKLCPLEKRDCRAESCPYAEGHYDRVNDALLSLMEKGKDVDSKELLDTALCFKVCPFELSLDYSEWCDFLILDYNYAFDPSAGLARYFGEGKKPYGLLVDEAHNLVDRARDMYSERLTKQEVLKARRLFPKTGLSKGEKQVVQGLSSLNALFLEAQKNLAEGGLLKERGHEALFDRLLSSMGHLQMRLQKALEESAKEKESYPNLSSGEVKQQLLELFFRLSFLQKLYEKERSRFAVYLEKDRAAGMLLRILCMDPSRELSGVYVKGSIYFSATLTPLVYYETLLSEEKVPAIALKSPFPPENKGVFQVSLPLTYRERASSVGRIPGLLHALCKAREGHYLAFFPSYELMEQVRELYERAYPEEEIFVQKADSDEADRSAFIGRFLDDTRPVLGFAVMGGMFSEGIDLPGEKLIGAAVITLGLPKVTTERNLMQDALGFEMAYEYPGLTKVLQAAGRVIRTPEDRGVVLLIDERFEKPKVRRLLEEALPMRLVTEARLGEELEKFWSERREL